ncbi:serine/threonine-protein kinase [Nocardia flavorosea]|uniref:serine/threonine-protein kinase n=1 Tax=Nocardia flavorosea TaxID=53429 RepID=UPI0007A3C664
MQAPGSEVGGRFGPYELRSLLGSGGMGEVYEAYDTVKERVVALKLLSGDLVGDPEYQTRFRRESQAAARLAEPHIIPIHDWGVIEGRLFIDMRLVAGTDLRSVLQAGGPLSPQRAVTVIEQIAAALDAAHVDGLVHRDVKPANILVTDTDFAYLADFGIAHHAGDSAVTQAGVAVGSYTYMAPERFERVPVTARADIYSLACVLHECLTGAQPFEAPSIGMLIRAHLAEPPPRASLQRTGLPAAFDDVIACGMAKDPHERFATAGELAVAARTALNSPARPPQSHAASAPGTGEFPATPVPSAESSPPTGGIPTLVVRIPNRDEDGTPDQTTVLPAIIPGDPTSVRPTEFEFTPLTSDDQAEPEVPGPGIRPFPDAHLYQNEQLHPAADPDSAPATGGMPVADFYPPDQATRIYGQGLGPTAPGTDDTTRVFEPPQTAPDPTGADATRAYRLPPGSADPEFRPGEPAHEPDDAYRSDLRAYGIRPQSFENGYRSSEYPLEGRPHGPGEQPLQPDEGGPRSGEYPVNAHGGTDRSAQSGDFRYRPDDDTRRVDDYTHVPPGAYGPDERGYPPAEGAYGQSAQAFRPDEGGHGSGEYPVDAHGGTGRAAQPGDFGYHPGDAPRRVDDDDQFPAGRAYGPEEGAYPRAEGPHGPGGAADPATGDWWTAERGAPSEDRQPGGPVSPGPGGLFGYGGAGSGPGDLQPDSYGSGAASGAPQPDPYAAAYEAGYRDSYMANAARPPASDREGQRSRTMPILAGAGVFVLVVLIAILGFTFLGSGGEEETPSAAEPTGAALTSTRSSAPATSTAPASTSTTTTTTRAAVPADAQPCTSASGGGAYGSAAAGTAVTSCEFAEAVRQAYLDPTVVSAEGEPVSIEATSPVTGQAYTLECVAADGLVTCRGGNNAVVYLY